jgi:cysteinyl-tRNA synthetase
VLRLHNTRTRTKEPFEPANPKRVTMYVCGPTVYSYAHIGNARPAVVFDVLFRLLRHVYGDAHVVYARNITDVDDKIMKASTEEGVPIDAITERYARIYREDMAALGVLPPTIEPTVTANMDAIIDMTKRLVDAGHAYAAEGHVLFSVASFPEYGELSGRSPEELLAGARVDVAPYKRDPGDFVLWKPSTPDQPGWDSPFGRGRPGWHLECSAMIEQHLGETIDIHGGGVDLVFPHHENEVAQSVCAHGGAPFVRVWMHNGFLNVQTEAMTEAQKMSKSLGNVLLVHDLVERHPGEALRYTLLSAHYRQPLDWTKDALHRSKKNLDRLYRTFLETKDVPDVELQPSRPLLDALQDDLNTPRALAELNELAKRAKSGPSPDARAEAKGQLRAGARLLGLLGQAPEAWLEATEPALEGELAARVEKLVAEREAARKAKDFARADAIRDELAAEGIVLVDSPSGTTWKRS